MCHLHVLGRIIVQRCVIAVFQLNIATVIGLRYRNIAINHSTQKGLTNSVLRSCGYDLATQFMWKGRYCINRRGKI